MTEDDLTMAVFQTLMVYNSNVNEAIENTKMVLAELFPVGAEEEVPF